MLCRLLQPIFPFDWKTNGCSSQGLSFHPLMVFMLIARVGNLFLEDLIGAAQKHEDQCYRHYVFMIADFEMFVRLPKLLNLLFSITS